MIGVAAKEKRDAAVDDARSKLPEVLTHFVGLHLEEDIMGAARKA
jgi:4'-phosphopantetheinyl transferase